MSSPDTDAPAKTSWMRVVVDYAAPIAFVLTLLLGKRFGAADPFQAATWVLVCVSAIALALGWLTERRLAPLPLFAGLAALVFGTLTLVFHDKTFVKMKLTFVDGALACVMFGGVLLKRNPLKSLMGEAVRLSDAAWRTLTLRYGAFFLVCAAANEFVWRTQSDARWGLFRLALLGAALLFSAAQAPFLLKHMQQPQAAGVAEPPDPGF